MVRQSNIDRVFTDISMQPHRYIMRQGYCEVSMTLLNIISDMNKELEELKEQMKNNKGI